MMHEDEIKPFSEQVMSVLCGQRNVTDTARRNDPKALLNAVDTPEPRGGLRFYH